MAMKKNIVGHMTAPRDTKKGFLRKLDLGPRILCLLLALLIWLAVVNVSDYDEKDNQPSSETTETDV